MLDREIVEAGLAALGTAIGELLEDDHLQAVSRLPASASDLAARFALLEQTGQDITALADAAAVLIRRGQLPFD